MHRLLDIADHIACRVGLGRPADWVHAIASASVRLYAGKLRRGLPQFTTHIGITPFFRSSRNICYDVTRLPYPIGDGVVDIYQSEDVFEHLPLEVQVPIYDEIYRVLKPGGLFRLSLPDYNFDGYKDRCIRSQAGGLLFDPGGGGRLEGERVVDGGHLWFPTIDLMRDLFDRSCFGRNGTVHFLHYTEADGVGVLNSIDYSVGHIQRTPDHDLRVHGARRPISIVIDAIKNG
jgi:SAM-dependent methyltransferase